MQDSISDQAARSLTLQLTGSERELMRKHYTENAAAYQAYLQGRYFWNKRDAAGFKKAIDYFQQAIEIDPDYALAHAGLADCYIRLNEYSVPMAQEAVPRGRAAVIKALLIDDHLAEAKARALEWLERAFDDRSLRPVWLKFDPRLDGLRLDGKLDDLIRRVGLTP